MSTVRYTGKEEKIDWVGGWSRPYNVLPCLTMSCPTVLYLLDNRTEPGKSSSVVYNGDSEQLKSAQPFRMMVLKMFNSRFASLLHTTVVRTVTLVT